MSRRRDALERYYEREEERLGDDLAAGRISQGEHDEATRDIQREAREEARAALEDDMRDVMDDWR